MFVAIAKKVGVIDSVDDIRIEVMTEKKNAEADDYKKLQDKNRELQVGIVFSLFISLFLSSPLHPSLPPSILPLFLYPSSLHLPRPPSLSLFPSLPYPPSLYPSLTLSPSILPLPSLPPPLPLTSFLPCSLTHSPPLPLTLSLSLRPSLLHFFTLII